jgi:hypothetical protein
MDRDTAHAHAAEVRRAYLHASRPPLPAALCALAAICAGVGVALVGQVSTGGWRYLTFLLAGVAMMATAHLIPALARRRRGLYGYRGTARTENIVFLLCAVVLIITGRNATADQALVQDGLGFVAAVAYYLTLRGKLVARDKAEA